MPVRSKGPQGSGDPEAFIAETLPKRARGKIKGVSLLRRSTPSTVSASIS